MYNAHSLCPVCGTNLVLHPKDEDGERIACVAKEDSAPPQVSVTALPPPRLDWAT